MCCHCCSSIHLNRMHIFLLVHLGTHCTVMRRSARAGPAATPAPGSPSAAPTPSAWRSTISRPAAAPPATRFTDSSLMLFLEHHPDPTDCAGAELPVRRLRGGECGPHPAGVSGGQRLRPGLLSSGNLQDSLVHIHLHLQDSLVRHVPPPASVPSSLDIPHCDLLYRLCSTHRNYLY